MTSPNQPGASAGAGAVSVDPVQVEGEAGELDDFDIGDLMDVMTNEGDEAEIPQPQPPHLQQTKSQSTTDDGMDEVEEELESSSSIIRQQKTSLTPSPVPNTQSPAFLSPTNALPGAPPFTVGIVPTKGIAPIGISGSTSPLTLTSVPLGAKPGKSGADGPSKSKKKRKAKDAPDSTATERTKQQKTTQPKTPTTTTSGTVGTSSDRLSFNPTFQPSAMKKLLHQLLAPLPANHIPTPLPVIMGELGKICLETVIQEAVHIRNSTNQLNSSGTIIERPPLTPAHIHESYRRLVASGVLPTRPSLHANATSTLPIFGWLDTSTDAPTVIPGQQRVRRPAWRR